MLFWIKNGNKIQKKSEKNRDGLEMMLGGHCFQGPTCIARYGNICISRSKTGIIGKKSERNWECWSILLGDAFRVQG